VPLHGRAAADPGVALKLRGGGFVLTFCGDALKGFAVDASVHGGEHVANDVGFHGNSFLGRVHPRLRKPW
jgi:hypothetical protein